MPEQPRSTSLRPVIWPTVAVVVALIIGALERAGQPQAVPRQIDLIAVFDAETNVFVARPDGWGGKVFGAEGEGGLMAVYASKEAAMVVLIQQAGMWTVDDAVADHQAELQSSSKHRWCGDAQPVELSGYRGLVFAYCDEGVLKNHQTDAKEPGGITHVVTTWVINGKIFRTQASSAGTVPNTGPDEECEKLIETLRGCALRIRFSPIDSVAPIEELSKL